MLLNIILTFEIDKTKYQNHYFILEDYNLVSKKRIKLNLEIEIDIPTDLITNRIRIKKVEDGIIKTISKGLYQEGLSFDIKKFNFDIENNNKFN